MMGRVLCFCNSIGYLPSESTIFLTFVLLQSIHRAMSMWLKYVHKANAPTQTNSGKEMVL